LNFLENAGIAIAYIVGKSHDLTFVSCMKMPLYLTAFRSERISITFSPNQIISVVFNKHNAKAVTDKAFVYMTLSKDVINDKMEMYRL
jgi:hypothetical protein